MLNYTNMAEAKTYSLTWENYKEQSAAHWPSLGRHLLAQYDQDCIVVYQAFCPDIADYAVKNGKFGGILKMFIHIKMLEISIYLLINVY